MNEITTRDDLTDRHVVVRAESVTRAYQDITWRVGLAVGGFGCKPGSRGSAVFVKHLRDDETARWERDDIERFATDEEVEAAKNA